MKIIVRMIVVTLAAVLSLAAQCNPPEPPTPDPPTPPDPSVIELDTITDIPCEGATITLKLTSAEDWEASIAEGNEWCILDKYRGVAGENDIIITVSPNDDFEGRSCEIRFIMGRSTGKVVVQQVQRNRLELVQSEYEVDYTICEIIPEILANIEYEVAVSEEWLSWTDGIITIDENSGDSSRSATVTFSGSGLTCDLFITQAAPPPPEEELDGKVTVLQTHTDGYGIPLVLMGDAFSKEQIEDSTYAALMGKAAEALFSIEPYTTYRNLFDIYIVNVVSEYYQDFYKAGSTTLGTYFGSGTFVGGDHAKCREYALKAVPEEAIDNSLVIILLNREVHAGRCYMQFVSTTPDGGENDNDDCAHGIAYSYSALGLNDEDFIGLIRHEAGGHGFGKLADEYFYEGYGAIPSSSADIYKSLQTLHHAYMNVDFCGDPETVLWSRFLQDERYAADELGLYEGACSFEYGAWRPSDDSIMCSNEGGFNAPSREAIYFRMHKLAFGRDWIYDYETFAEYDTINRKTAPEDEPEDGNDETTVEGGARRCRTGALWEPCPMPEIIN